MKGTADKSIFPDNILLFLSVVLLITGLFIFMSASFGLLAREGPGWSSVLFTQLILGLFGGLILGFFAYIIPLRLLRRFAVHIFILSVLGCLLVFIPGLGLKAGGAARWIVIMGTSFQPSEFLKLAIIILLSAWGAGLGNDIKTTRYGLIPFLGILGIVAGLILTEPDTGTFLVIFTTAVCMFLISGGKIKHLLSIILGMILLIGILALFRPYVRARIATFINPSTDPLGNSYQIRQSLLTIGSGRLTGRGFGQSIQKFQYLPEPMGDSIFAVLGEEFGFLGTMTLVLLYLSLFLRGLFVAARSTNKFNRLLASGIAIMIIVEAYLHVGALIGIFPLTGVPLPLVSHGGTALMFSIISLGLLLQVSRFKTDS
ncbi:MAG TPA: FtsW/RodA/SpoVE family cell cycle protein [Candidatus Paceibacterota bacterium]